MTRPEERSSQRRRRKGTKLPEEQGMENERMGNGARKNWKRKARERKLPEGKARDGRRALRNKKSARLAGLKHTENNQQSIARTTHFFSTTEMFGRNTPFSARFRNHLTLKHLHSSRTISHCTFIIFHYKTCLFAMRNMPTGRAKDAKRWVG